MKTALEKKLEKMPPEQRRKAVQEISDMMGIPPQRKQIRKSKR